MPNFGGLREAMREGIDVIRDTPVVRRITFTTLAWNLAFYGSEALIVPFLRDVIPSTAGTSAGCSASGR